MLYVLSFCIKSELRDIPWFETIDTFTYTIIKGKHTLCIPTSKVFTGVKVHCRATLDDHQENKFKSTVAFY